MCIVMIRNVFAERIVYEFNNLKEAKDFYLDKLNECECELFRLEEQKFLGGLENDVQTAIQNDLIFKTIQIHDEKDNIIRFKEITFSPYIWGDIYN